MIFERLTLFARLWSKMEIPLVVRREDLAKLEERKIQLYAQKVVTCECPLDEIISKMDHSRFDACSL